MNASKIVMEYLNSRQRGAAKTDLSNVYRIVHRIHPELSEDDFMSVFKAMQAQGLGSMVIGRNGNPNRFVWKYTLKETAEKFKLSTIPAVSQVKATRAPRRPRLSQIVINLDPNTPKIELEALIKLAKGLDTSK